MSLQNVKEEKITLPEHIKRLQLDEVNQYRIHFGVNQNESLTVEDCRDLLDTKLSNTSLSDLMIEQRRDARN